jgi:hypothetical protein
MHYQVSKAGFLATNSLHTTMLQTPRCNQDLILHIDLDVKNENKCLAFTDVILLKNIIVIYLTISYYYLDFGEVYKHYNIDYSKLNSN